MSANLDVGCHLNVVAPDASLEQLPELLAGLADIGFRRLVLPPLNPERTDVPRLRAMLLDHGLTPIAFAGLAPGGDVSSPDPAERTAGVRALRAALDFAVSLGSDQLNGVPYGLFGPPAGPTDRAAFERSATEVGRVADEARECGVLMNFEVLNRYETSLVNTAAQAVEYVAMSGSNNLRVHLDTFHMSVEETDLAAAISLALPWLGYFELGQSGRGSLSSGLIDNQSLVAHALDIGYLGRFGVEAFSRSILTAEDSALRFIWREPFTDGLGVAREGMTLIRAAAER